MLFYYIRHGDPTYKPDALTPLGHRQAEAIGRRLSREGVDRIYASTSVRAMETAAPLCEILKKELTTLDFARESKAYGEFNVTLPDGVRMWVFNSPYHRRLMQSDEVYALGYRWYEHPELAFLKAGYERVQTEAAAFFASLGYERIEESGAFRVVAPVGERVALFAHQGFGMAFLSWLMHIPYPKFCTQFDITHTGMTVIQLKEEDGLCYPKLLVHSAMEHLYKEDLPMDYNHEVKL